ncbi:MAG TPA: condensation domain-containing protein, partial [Pyrinomonadaceae bacterium]|nr:condensation domain-containing protein [Pyrinomonadaceae bacterium]
LFQQLKFASRRESASLFMILVAAFQTLLFCHSRQEDVRVGTLIANRNRSETEDLLGLFVNTVVLRSNFSGDPTYREALQRVRRVVLEAFNNQDLPFEQLLQVLERERDLDRTALIEMLFILQNAPLQPLDLPGLRVSHIQEVSDLADAGVTLTMFDLILMMGEGPDGLTASLKYKTELFDESTIRRLFDEFVQVLESIVSQPDEKLVNTVTR